MSTKTTQEGRIYQATAGGAVAVGSVQEVNGLIGVAQGAAVASGDLYALALTGVHEIAKKTGETWTVGDDLYWDASAGTASKTYVDSAADFYLGKSWASAGSSDTTGQCRLGPDAPGASGGGVVQTSMYDAYSILAADTADTPAALTVGASTIVGRKASGGIVAMSASEAATVLQGGGAIVDSELVHYDVTVPNGGTDVTTALATAGFTTGKPIFGMITNNTSNLVGLSKIYISGSDFVAVISGDPGATGATVSCWQDKR